ncbi:FecR domain-containing protein [Phenylobacterium sp. J426]|uniref:FecR family protein n=1 Tax=Phenylobacterium sp. J426 TaxID=2898439 RepID=UPI002150B88B|nr:FecR domain-containing protein [Phenylobacterium sp. J426]MCR5876661.1 FecR domain-containing protein [Phenylobacterium sp. J426]
MSDPGSRRARAQEEAAEWLARLGNHSISTQTVRDFRDWRDDPVNDTAYEEAEAFWEASGRHAADPEIMRMTQEALARGRRGSLWGWLRKPLGSASALALATTAVATAVVLTGQMQPAYSTKDVEQKVVRLEDGSRVHLNVDSRVRVKFTREGRQIVLTRGEAFFDVAHDPGRPFVVTAGPAEVRALGTKFDVRRQADGDVQVVLVQGSVRVAGSGAPTAVTLLPNQQAVLAQGGSIRTAPTNAVNATSWTTGRLTFRQTPLAAAVAEVNRYSDRDVVLSDPALGQRSVSGFFDVGDTEAFARGVAELFDLTVTTKPDGRYQLSPPTPSAPDA